MGAATVEANTDLQVEGEALGCAYDGFKVVVGTI
jgi:hypothetical protein